MAALLSIDFDRIGVEGQLADAGDEVAVGDELAALALLAEAEVLELHDDGDGEAVVDRGVLDVARRDARFLEGRFAGLRAAGVGEVDVAGHLVLGRFAGADDLHLRALQALGDLGPRDDERAAAVADDAAVEPMQRVGDHRRVDDVLDGDDVAQHGVRVVLGVMRGGDLDPGELLAGRAELVHVAHGAHGVHVGGGRPVGKLELQVGLVRIAGARRGAGGHALAARPAGERDQRDVALAGGDRLAPRGRRARDRTSRRCRSNRRGAASGPCSRPSTGRRGPACRRRRRSSRRHRPW